MRSWHTVARKTLERTIVNCDEPSHLGVILAQYIHDFFRRGGFRESREAAEIQKHHVISRR